MNEEQLINQIKQLKTITPNSDWVLSNKTNLLGEEKHIDWALFFRPALVGASLFAVMVAFNLSQDSLPGELLFALKRLTESKDMMLCSQGERPFRNFELAHKRLEELYVIAENNDVKKIAPAINEFQLTMEGVTKELSKAYVTGNEMNEELIDEANKLEEAKEIVGQTLASEFGGDSYDEYRVARAHLEIQLAENKIELLRLAELNEEDNDKLDQMNEDLELARDYLDNEDCNPAFKIISEVLIRISDLSKEKQIQ